VNKKEIKTDKAPAALGPYSQGVVSGGLVFVSGQTPLIPETGEIVSEDIEAQTEQSLKNIAGVLEQSGLGFADVIKTTVFLKDMNDFTKMNAVYAAHFPAPFPARSTVEVARLPKDVRVEIEVIASLG